MAGEANVPSFNDQTPLTLLLEPIHYNFTDRLIGLKLNVPLDTTTTTTTTILWPFVWIYLVEPVPEETFTHSHLLWSSTIPFQLPPSTTIHSIFPGLCRFFFFPISIFSSFPVLFQQLPHSTTMFPYACMGLLTINM